MIDKKVNQVSFIKPKLNIDLLFSIEANIKGINSNIVNIIEKYTDLIISFIMSTYVYFLLI